MQSAALGNTAAAYAMPNAALPTSVITHTLIVDFLIPIIDVIWFQIMPLLPPQQVGFACKILLILNFISNMYQIRMLQCPKTVI